MNITETCISDMKMQGFCRSTRLTLSGLLRPYSLKPILNRIFAGIICSKEIISPWEPSWLITWLPSWLSFCSQSDLVSFGLKKIKNFRNSSDRLLRDRRSISPSFRIWPVMHCSVMQGMHSFISWLRLWSLRVMLLLSVEARSFPCTVLRTLPCSVIKTEPLWTVS